MPADKVTHGTDVEASRVRTGPRHAAPKKPLFTRFHVPAGKAIALAAMPTAVLMGMGFTPTLALADDQPASKSLTADEYKDCLTALEDGASPSASPSPSTSASGDDKDTSDGSSDSSDKGDSAEPNPSASSDGAGSSGDSSSDSGSGDQADPTPSPSASSGGESDSASEASPSPSESGGNLLEGIGDAITGIFTGGTKATDSASPTPSATPSASASPDSSGDGSDGAASTDKGTSDSLKDATEKVTDTVGDTVKDTTDGASKTVEDTTKAVEKAAEGAADGVTASPSPSESSGTDAEDCPVATDEEGGVDNTVPLPDNPWYLDASSLLLRGADYQGVVTVKTAGGTTKKVLKYVVSDGIDIGDLHQTVNDKQSGKTYHVQAGKGTTSTFRDGKTLMYTESISGKLFGLIPVTFSPDSPPPLNIPLIYFTDVKVVQAGQFGGTLHIPGLHNYMTG